MHIAFIRQLLNTEIRVTHRRKKKTKDEYEKIQYLYWEYIKHKPSSINQLEKLKKKDLVFDYNRDSNLWPYHVQNSKRKRYEFPILTLKTSWRVIKRVILSTRTKYTPLTHFSSHPLNFPLTRIRTHPFNLCFLLSYFLFPTKIKHKNLFASFKKKTNLQNLFILFPFSSNMLESLIAKIKSIFK